MREVKEVVRVNEMYRKCLGGGGVVGEGKGNGQRLSASWVNEEARGPIRWVAVG